MNIYNGYYQRSRYLSSNDYIIKSPTFSANIGVDGANMVLLFFICDNFIIFVFFFLKFEINVIMLKHVYFFFMELFANNSLI